MVDQGPTFPLLSIPPPAPKLEHEAAAATSAGEGSERTADAVSIFTFVAAGEPWNAVVMAVASGRHGSARRGLASVVAVDVLQADLNASADRLDFTSPDWQEPLSSALTSAFERANSAVGRLLDSPGADASQGVALAATVVVGDWLCAAHVGDCRVFRLSSNQLEQLTADRGSPYSNLGQGPERPMRPLGLMGAVTPTIGFFHLKAGDVVLAGSDGLCRSLDGDETARLIRERLSIADIAKSLVAVAGARTGGDDMSACLARIGRLRAKLPAPSGGLDPAPGRHQVKLPRYLARGAAPRESLRLSVALGVLGVVAGVGSLGLAALFGESRPQSTSRLAGATVVAVDPELLQPNGSSSVKPVLPPVRLLEPTAPPITRPPPTGLQNSVAKAPLETNRRPASTDLRERQVRAAAVPVTQTSVEDSIPRDSAVAAQEIEAAERAANRRREATRADPEARERPEAESGADRTAAVPLVPTAAPPPQPSDERLVAGRNALSGWMSGLVSTVNAGTVSAPVLAAGPPGFAAFVKRNRPRLSDARLVTVSVNEATGEATVQWLARWRTEFGTSASRHMKAAATVVSDGDTWRLSGWRIVDGVP